MADREHNVSLRGVGISPGLAVGTAFIYQDILQRDHELYGIEQDQIDDEYGRIEEIVPLVVEIHEIGYGDIV